MNSVKILIKIIILLCSVDSFAQYDWDSKHWDKKSLGFGCSLSGQMTVPVTKMTHLLTERKIKRIKEALNSKLPAEKYLAIFLLEKLSEKRELEITDDEQRKIREIKGSNEMVPFCSGCTLWTEVPLKELFDTKTQEIVSVSANYWFEKYYREKR